MCFACVEVEEEKGKMSCSGKLLVGRCPRTLEKIVKKRQIPTENPIDEQNWD